MILDEEHSLYRLEVEERNGHARSMTVAADTVLSSEFRALSATYRDLRGLAWPATVSADAAAESDDAEEAAEGEGKAAEAAWPRAAKGRAADVTITGPDELVDHFIAQGMGIAKQVEFAHEAPTYRLIPGISRVSHADRVARKIGVSKEDIDNYLAGSS